MFIGKTNGSSNEENYDSANGSDTGIAKEVEPSLGLACREALFIYPQGQKLESNSRHKNKSSKVPLDKSTKAQKSLDPQAQNRKGTLTHKQKTLKLP